MRSADETCGSGSSAPGAKEPLPTISVVVAVLNGAATLQRCIDSFRRQTYGPRELVVVDGGSHDDTVRVIRRNASTVAHWHSEPDRGVYDAWNKAVRHVRGEWICFLGADDFFWAPDSLERLAVVLPAIRDAHPFVYGQVAVVRESGSVLRVVGDDWDVVRGSLLKHMPIPHAGMLHHRSLFERIGQFDDSFRVAGDYEFLLRGLSMGSPLFVRGGIVVGMTYGGISTDLLRVPAILIEEAVARHKNGFPALSSGWVARFVRGSVRAVASRMFGERLVRWAAIQKGRLSGRKSSWDNS